MNARVAIAISGGGSNMVSLVQAMTGDFPARPALVVSNNPDAGGLAKASALGVPTAVVNHREFGTRDDFDRALDKVLRDGAADFICLAGFMRILGPEFTANWAGRMLNIHPSLLPKYPGLNTHARALKAGDAQAGCSVHWVTSGLDEGPVVGQAAVDVRPSDTAESLAARVLEKEHILYPRALRAVLGGAETPIIL